MTFIANYGVRRKAFRQRFDIGGVFDPYVEIDRGREMDGASARLQCPHFASLSLDEQLAHRDEDLLMATQRAATSREHAEEVARRAPKSKESATVQLEVYRHELSAIVVDTK